MEFIKVLAQSSADVDDRDGFFIVAHIPACAQPFFHWVETGVHPARAALAVAGHEVIEGTTDIGVGLEPFPECLVCLVAVLEDAVDGIRWICVLCLLQIGWEVDERGTAAVEAEEVELKQSWSEGKAEQTST